VSERYREVFEVLGATVRSLLSTNQCLKHELSDASQAVNSRESALSGIRAQLAAAEALAAAERNDRQRVEAELDCIRVDAEALSSSLRTESGVRVG
jgi:hypothetical protein